MEESFLKKIDDYIKQNGIPFKEIYFKPTNFPYYFNKTILDKFYEINPHVIQFIDNTYTFMYDNNGNFILLCTANDGRDRLVISDKLGDISLDFKFSFLSTKKFVDSMCVEKYIHNSRYEIDESIKKFNFDTKKDRFVFEEKVSNTFMRELKRILLSNKIDLSSLADCSKDIEKVTSNVIDYIDYLNKVYIESKEIDSIYYTPTESETDIKRGTPEKYPREQKERLNDIIAVSDRDTFLSEIPGLLYESAAMSSVTGKTTHICYIYQLHDGEHRLILEPLSGEGRTKLVSFVSEEPMSSEVASSLIKRCLEYSDVETKEAENIVRINHTNLDTFKKNIMYSLTGDSKTYQCNPYFKGNVDKSVPLYIEDILNVTL